MMTTFPRTSSDQNNSIIRHKREESAADLAESYEVSERMIYKILKEYHETGCVPGEKRKKTKLSKQEEELIQEWFNECDLWTVGLGTSIEKTRGIHIPHNKIHA